MLILEWDANTTLFVKVKESPALDWWYRYKFAAAVCTCVGVRVALERVYKLSSIGSMSHGRHEKLRNMVVAECGKMFTVDGVGWGKGGIL